MPERGVISKKVLPPFYHGPRQQAGQQPSVGQVDACASSSKPARGLKIQPGIARNRPIRFSVAEAANEIRLDALTCEERAVNTCVVEARYCSGLILPDAFKRTDGGI